MAKSRKRAQIQKKDKAENDLKYEIWRLHSTGIPSHEIADRLDLDKKEVEQKIQEIARDVADVISEKSAMEMTAEIVSRYDYLFRICLEELEKAGIKEKPLFLRVATAISKNKEELLKDTGLIPKEPQKLEYKIAGRIQHEHKAIQEEQRTDEEIEQNIINLLRYGLVLGEGKEEVIDAEYEEKSSEQKEVDIERKEKDGETN